MKSDVLFYGKFRYCRDFFLFGFQFFQDHFDGFVQLLVFAVELQVRIVFQQNIRIYPVTFDDKAATVSCKRSIGGGDDRTSVDYRNGAAVTDYSSPCPVADDRTQFIEFKTLGEQVSVGCRVFVYQ